jgi:hypothetical protein
VKWSSDKPAGAVILIRVQPIGPFEAERAAVVVGESATDHWTFTTIWTENSEVHPVSGNRTFGFRPHGDQYVYFTRGADRFSQPGYWAMSKIVRSGQESLWHSLQSRFADFVNARQGRARVLAPYIAYPSWEDERIRTSFQPSVDWETVRP